ncbi:armadillo-type protein [Phycomyces blakesleeanus]|uniref:Armadillo-type protein n=1 Tax=Phycomyces blakesleeanus TaxID=4837 RepID=A0ABR3B9E8_PHYBL
MGKQPQRRKITKNRVNPLGARIAAGVSQGISEDVPKPEQVMPVIEKLSSPDPTERAWSAACISNLVMAGAATRKLLLSKGIIPKLIERLTDSNQDVKEETLGTLRNLVSVDPVVANDYYARDILTPLSALLPTISQTIDLVLKNAPFADHDDQDKRRTVWDVAENFIYIVWSIIEASDKYIKAINRLNIITFLISFLSAADQCPTRVVVAAGQCLTTLTDENKDIYIEFQNHPEYISTLVGILTKFTRPEDTLVRVLACAILMNLREVMRMSSSWDDDQDPLVELNKMVLPVLISSLDYDLQVAAEQSLVAANSGKITKHEETGEITPAPKQPVNAEERYVQSVEERLTTLQLSLELLADICTQDDTEEDGWEEADETMGDDEGEPIEEEDEDTEDILGEVSALTGGTSSASEDALIRSNPVMHAFTYQIFPHLIRLATPTPLSFPQESIVPTVSQGLALTHLRSLECLNNFLLAMNDVPSKFWFKEHISDAQQTWTWLIKLLYDLTPANGGADDILADNLEAIVGCLWSLARGLGNNTPLGPNDNEVLCRTCTLIPVVSIRVKIIGCLGAIATRQGNIEFNKNIAIYVTDILRNIPTKQTPPELAVEVLNFMYDVYNDCAFDYDEPIFVKGNMIKELESILPAYRAIVKSIDRRKNFDLRSRADEALTNLVAFIKYKKNERR